MSNRSLALMSGVDIPIPQCRLVLHQPTIKEISFLGDTDFFVAVQCLSLNKSAFAQDESVLASVSNFQIFMTVMSEKETLDKKENVQQLLSLLFPKYKILFTPRALIFSNENESVVIDENNFEILQEVLRDIFCVTTGPMDQNAFNPADAEAREIADKLTRARKRVAEQNSSGGSNTFSQYLSMLTVGLGSMSLCDLLNLTMYQLYDIVERYMLYINWDIDIRSRLAGAKAESKPDNWMKNIH